MDRLTAWAGEGGERYAIPSPRIRPNGHQRCTNRLAEYEDLGVSPDEVRQIDREYTRLATEAAAYRKAGREGRLAVLPCKPGDTLYAISLGEMASIEVLRVTYEIEAENYGVFIRGRIIASFPNGDPVQIDFDEVGKNWFYTKEQAWDAWKKAEKEAAAAI